MLNDIVVWLKDVLKKTQAKGYVIGLSGGIDSAVTAGLVKKASEKNHLALYMPCQSNPEDAAYASETAKILNLNLKTVDLTPVLNSFQQVLPNGTNVHVGNIKARLRMITLYHYAAMNGYLVAGTGNKTEYLLGYFTKFGDGAYDVAPIADFLKRDVRLLGEKLGLPPHIVNRPPSAGLWPGQTDEEEIGLSYDTLDKAVIGLEEGSTIVTFQAMEKVVDMHQNSQHKRELPRIYKQFR